MAHIVPNAKALTRHLSYIGGGINAAVYGPRRGDYVIKHGLNDATRTYLEWVMWRTLHGRRMRGMPWIDYIRDEPAERYSARMARYIPMTAADNTPVSGRDPDHWITSVHQHPSAPSYIKALIGAFETETGVPADDLHSHNVMVDKDTGDWIVTDPSAEGYEPLALH